MRWTVLLTDEYADWLESLNEKAQNDIIADIRLLEEVGPTLSRPKSDTLYDSKLSNLKELITQHRGKPYRSLYAFDPNREAIMLLGGNKAGKKRWYKENIPIAEARYQEHLDSLETEE